MNKRETGLLDYVELRGHGAGQILTDIEAACPGTAPLHAIWPGRSALSAAHLPILASALELMLVAFATFMAGLVYHDIVFGELAKPDLYLAATCALAALFVGASAFAWDYSVNHLTDPRNQIGRIFRRWNQAYAFFVFALFMTQATEFYSRGTLIAQYGAGFAAALAFRLVLTRMVAAGRANGVLGGKRLVLIGTRDLVSAMLRRLDEERGAAEVVGVVIVPAQEAGESRKAALAGVLAKASAVARQSEPDDIVLCLPWSGGEGIDMLRDGLAMVPARVHLAPELDAAWSRDPETARVGSMRTLRLSRAPLSLRDRVLKRGFDVAVASCLLIAAAPLLALIAAAIKLDSPGPVLFRQRRCGFNQRTFRVFKFRSMTTMDDGAEVPQAMRGDTRITRVGAILRATNLDELPQLLNVLTGQMSLVGPRPHALAHDTEYGEKIRIYANRHKVKPGITGWAQVNGFRGSTQRLERMHRRIEHDMHYIEHWSLMLDVKILVMTLASPSSYRNAY